MDGPRAKFPSVGDITIGDWIVQERQRLQNFERFWRYGQAGLNPDGIPPSNFPGKMPEGEWDEQYRSWGDG